MKAVREALVLLLVATAPAAMSVWLHPQLADRNRAGLDPHEVRLAEVREWSAPVLWVDARGEAAFAAGTVPTAVHLAPERFAVDLGNVLSAWQPGTRVVVFCSTLDCATSKEIARQLRDAGLAEVFHLRGGWEAWEQARQP